MTNNVAEGSFQIFLHEKVIFHFLSAINQYFVKDLPKFNFKIGPKQSPKILDHSGFTIHHLVEQ
jgi:hypothetical protein